VSPQGEKISMSHDPEHEKREITVSIDFFFIDVAIQLVSEIQDADDVLLITMKQCSHFIA
jgi:hypothetical protein